MVVFDIDTEVKEASRAEAAEGKLHKQYVEDKLMSSVLASDKKTLDHAELVQEATNRSVGSFTPEMMFSQLVNNFSMAKQLYGEKMIQLLSGYNPNYIEKNSRIPEFRKELRKSLEQKYEQLRDDDLVTGEGTFTPKAMELGRLALVAELDKYIAKDLMGQKISRELEHYGEKSSSRPHRKGDRYRDLNIKQTIHRAVRRGHSTVRAEDLITSERQAKGRISIILALDASASMKGNKLETCKKAGIALAHKAIEAKDTVGMVVFGSEIKNSIPPTNDFTSLLAAISQIRASKQTDFAAVVFKAIELFPSGGHTKHLLIVTDALPTVGKDPEKETLKAVSAAKSAGITVSLIGINLDREGLDLAQNITRVGSGKLSVVRNLGDLGGFVLEDYYSFK